MHSGLMVHSVSGKYLEHHLAMLLRIRILKVLMLPLKEILQIEKDRAL